MTCIYNLLDKRKLIVFAVYSSTVHRDQQLHKWYLGDRHKRHLHNQSCVVTKGRLENRVFVDEL
jgi:hypothetical protein